MARYLGNRHHMEVHDTMNPKLGCQLGEIKPEHREWFNSLGEAKLVGYDNCAWCLGGSTR